MSNREQEIEHLEKLRARHQANIRKLEEMLAVYGPLDSPLHLLNGLEIEQGQLREVEEKLAAIHREEPEEDAGRPAEPGPLSESLELSYLRRVLNSCNVLPLAVIDPRAVERTRQKTMDLLAVYVALDTQTPVAVEGEESEDKGKRRRPEVMLEAARETRPLSALEAAARDRQWGKKRARDGDRGAGERTGWLYRPTGGADVDRRTNPEPQGFCSGGGRRAGAR